MVKQAYKQAYIAFAVNEATDALAGKDGMDIDGHGRLTSQPRMTAHSAAASFMSRCPSEHRTAAAVPATLPARKDRPRYS